MPGNCLEESVTEKLMCQIQEYLERRAVYLLNIC